MARHVERDRHRDADIGAQPLHGAIGLAKQQLRFEQHRIELRRAFERVARIGGVAEPEQAASAHVAREAVVAPTLGFGDRVGEAIQPQLRLHDEHGELAIARRDARC